MTESEVRPTCVNCQFGRQCIIVKELRNYKEHINVIGLHCGDWEPEIHDDQI
jgi:hypothetical protein